jgi:hypothetical protein
LTHKKLIQEADYQNMKNQTYFHDSSWYMRGANGYDGKGCKQYTGCVPEGQYFNPYLHPALKEEESEEQIL